MKPTQTTRKSPWVYCTGGWGTDNRRRRRIERRIRQRETAREIVSSR